MGDPYPQRVGDVGYCDPFGHSVGLQIHQAPGIGAASAGPLFAGSVVTVEPAVCPLGRGGDRIEETPC